MTCCSPAHSTPQYLGGQVTGYSAWLLTIRGPWQGPHPERQREGLQTKLDNLYFLDTPPGLLSECSRGGGASVLLPSPPSPQVQAGGGVWPPLALLGVGPGRK